MLGWSVNRSAGVRDGFLLHEGATIMNKLLIQLDQPAELPIRRSVTCTVANFCGGKPLPAFKLVRSSLPTLARLVLTQDDVRVCRNYEMAKNRFYALNQSEATRTR